MFTRVATSSGYRLMLGNLQTSARGLLLAQEQATSGKRIVRMSDAPADAVSVLGQRAELRRLEQFSRNTLEASSWLSASDAALLGVSDRMASARTLLVQANSGGVDAAARQTIADELRAMREALLQSANTTRDGRPLFAGSAAVSAAYDSAGTYAGDATALSVPVAPGMSLQVNQSGEAVFGTHHATDPMAGDVFQLLEALAVAVENGDATTVSTGIALVDQAIDRAGVAHVAIGSRARQLEELANSVEDAKVTVRQSISLREDIDLAESVLNLKQREVAYQAALQATASVIQPSLMDFLR